MTPEIPQTVMKIATAVQESVKLTIVLVQNHGFASIGALSESVGSQRFGTSYRTREDLAMVAQGLGANVVANTHFREHRSGLRSTAVVR